ncbi:MAG: acyl-ACP--UDP-N-acetylglucosamine O-acyltransferase [Muribaculaceae bacterium]|nr:acyl-ACP--UDP-N-acetylglucosamine O-acyltransferase [Muribaculaceae bacterium]
MISPLAYVDPSAKLGKDVKIHPFAYIDANVEIGDGCEILPYASIIRGTRMGKGNKIYQGAIIGADPQDFRWKGQETYCFIGDHNVIREHVIINRGIYSQGGTTVGNDTFIMAECHIGHDSVLKGRCVLGNGVNVAGDVTIHKGVILSSNAIIHEGCNVGAYSVIKGGCRISSNVPPYVIIAHNPATYYGVNASIMRTHGGFTDAQIDDVAKAYRHIYQCGTSLFNALKRIEVDIEPSKVRDNILNFIRDNKMKIVADRFMED